MLYSFRFFGIAAIAICVIALTVFWSFVSEKTWTNWTKPGPNCIKFPSGLPIEEFEVLAVRELRSSSASKFLLGLSKQPETAMLSNSSVRRHVQTEEDPDITEWDLARYKLQTEVGQTLTEFGFDDCGKVLYVTFLEDLPGLEDTSPSN